MTDFQDWTQVVIRGTKNVPAASGAASSRIQQRLGEAKNIGAHLAKLEEKEVGKLKMLHPESRTALIQARVAMKLTQVQLDQRLAFPPHTIRDIEAGKIAPTGQQLNKLNNFFRISPGLRLG